MLLQTKIMVIKQVIHQSGYIILIENPTQQVLDNLKFLLSRLSDENFNIIITEDISVIELKNPSLSKEEFFERMAMLLSFIQMASKKNNLFIQRLFCEAGQPFENKPEESIEEMIQNFLECPALPVIFSSLAFLYKLIEE